MAELNELIIDKLRNYNDDIVELAIQALKYAEEYSEQTVAEQLENVVRQIVKKKGNQE